MMMIDDLNDGLIWALDIWKMVQHLRGVWDALVYRLSLLAFD